MEMTCMCLHFLLNTQINNYIKILLTLINSMDKVSNIYTLACIKYVRSENLIHRMYVDCTYSQRVNKSLG